MTAPLGTRDRLGHLSGLALDRYRFDPTITAEFRRDVEVHLEACAVCRAADAALQGSDAGFDAALFIRRARSRENQDLVDRSHGPIPSEPRELAAARRAHHLARRGAGVAVGLALAATALVVGLRTLAPDAEPAGLAPDAEGVDRILAKGGSFDFEVWIDDGADGRQVRSGDHVHPGERFGFRVHARSDGWLLIAGVDNRQDLYGCYPEAATEPPDAPLRAARFGRTEAPIALDIGMRFDEILGGERLVALFCPTAPPPEFVRALLVPTDPAAASCTDAACHGCEVATVQLTKVAR